MTRRSWFLVLAFALAGFLGFQVGQQWPDGGEASGEAAAESRPLIGIASLDQEAYLRAVREAGGIPVVLPSSEGLSLVDDYLERLDGLLMPGGLDIPPATYGEEPHVTVEPLGESRFAFERELGTAWIERSEKPLLGICLGSQWMNVLRGGTLIQDIPSERGGNHRATTHPVTLEPDSRLAGILGATDFEVNSNHHQAVDTLGEGLRIVARSPDGIVEATEGVEAGRFLIGVQWHPERMVPDDERQRKLFRAFVEAAREGRGR